MARLGFLRRGADPEKLMDWQATAAKVGSREPVHCRETESVSKAVEMMDFFGFRRLPVTDGEGRLRGIVTTTDVLEFLARGRALRTPVKDVMSEPWAVEHWSSLYRTLGLFHRYRKGGYPVVHDERLKGMITDFDIVKGIQRPLGMKVSSIMTHKPMVVGENEPILYASRMMSRGFRRLPVVKDGILVGIITPHDVISHLKARGKLAGLRRSDRAVRDVMTRDVVTVEPGMDAYAAVRLIKSLGIGGLPVAEDHEVMGIITERDIVNLMRP
jgi:CBS domain-containing protein